ncbi:hypothetical protein F53441_11221 [Fusarium austroafricanum]|uniref:Fe2OG dioxygenase domain-containing protein n=1 Tax=Fusarium austroafricanum TaxID=2364996 RepID=A0A8H4K7E7_9HYPO|nr:hypothetical protein F53441_11221 [Fusarium austroafricanum]
MGSLETIIPPFPNDLPTVPIARISYSKLTCSDEHEINKVFKACLSDGFFYLDLTDHPAGQLLLSDAQEVLSFSKEALNLPLDKKMEFLAECGKEMFGYKPAGAVKKTDKDSRPDTTEFFNVGKDHLLGNSKTREYPEEITHHWSALGKFARDCHTLGLLILEILAEALDLSPNEFVRRNNISPLSGDHIRMTKMPASGPQDNAIGLPSHTDFGSITVLFNWIGGLQIQSHDPAKQGEWAYVKPLPGHAIINLGDAMVKFTNGRLKSGKHRVVPLPEAPDRYSLVYFVRPADEVLMEPVEQYKDECVVAVGGKVGEERVYTVGEWLARRLKQMSK